jgi:hypothetical protein
VRWNSLVQSLRGNALGSAPNIFNRCERNRSEPPTAGGDSGAERLVSLSQTARNFPAELFYLLQFRAYVQRQFLIAEYSDPNVSSADLAGVKRFYSISQDGFA